MMPPTAAQLLALTTSCTQVSNGLYRKSASDPPTVPVCSLNGAYFYTSGMNVDCDGKTTTQCNINADPDYQNQTSAVDSTGHPLDAANLPYVVLPIPSTIFSFGAHGVKLGQIIAVIYNGKLNYGVYGDSGPSADIGEASYAMAKSLGIDPNPSTGGTSGPVTYIVFTGSSAVASPIEDHAGTVTKGQNLATNLLAANGGG
jgi:hypothetical protein